MTYSTEWRFYMNWSKQVRFKQLTTIWARRFKAGPSDFEPKPHELIGLGQEHCNLSFSQLPDVLTIHLKVATVPTLASGETWPTVYNSYILWYLVDTKQTNGWLIPRIPWLLFRLPVFANNLTWEYLGDPLDIFRANNSGLLRHFFPRKRQICCPTDSEFGSQNNQCPMPPTLSWVRYFWRFRRLLTQRK